MYTCSEKLPINMIVSFTVMVPRIRFVHKQESGMQFFHGLNVGRCTFFCYRAYLRHT